MSGVEFTGEPTENVEVEDLALSHDHWELRIVQAGLREFRLPFYFETLDLSEHAKSAFPEGTPWSASLTEDGAILTNSESGAELSLAVGESVQLENRSVWLVDVRQPPLGSLEGVSTEISGRVWHLKNQLTWLGRKGKRMNHLELDHPTISRTQATITVDMSGRVSLLAEAAKSPTTVNGELLEAGLSRQVSQGDLLGFGKLQFRLSLGTEASAQESALFIKTLGSFRLTLGSDSGPEVLVESEKARWLLASLGTSWSSALAIEPLLENFWPGIDRTKCRKNLSYTLRQTRDAFRNAGADLDDFIIRSPSEYRIKPERRGGHDYIELLSFVSSREALTSVASLQRVLKLHRGEFLPTCYENWASSVRQSLEADINQTLIASCRYFLEQGEFDAVKAAADHLQKFDPLGEEGVLFHMQAFLGCADPKGAVELFEKFEVQLKNEELEPSIELLKCYQRARLGL